MTIATFSDRTATFPQTAATNAAGTATPTSPALIPEWDSCSRPSR